MGAELTGKGVSLGVLKGNVISKLLIKNLHFNVLIQILFIPVQPGGAKLVPGMWQSPGGAGGGIWEQRQSLHLGLFTELEHTAAITQPQNPPLLREFCCQD